MNNFINIINLTLLVAWRAVKVKVDLPSPDPHKLKDIFTNLIRI
jgi:hypothetical protein